MKIYTLHFVHIMALEFPKRESDGLNSMGHFGEHFQTECMAFFINYTSSVLSVLIRLMIVYLQIEPFTENN